MQLSRSHWLWHFKVTLWGFELITNYHPFITTLILNALTTIVYSYTAVYSVNSNYLSSKAKQKENCSNNSLVKSTVFFSIFCQVSIICKGSANLLTESYTQEKKKLGRFLIHRWIRTGGVLNLGSLDSPLHRSKMIFVEFMQH